MRTMFMRAVMSWQLSASHFLISLSGAIPTTHIDASSLPHYHAPGTRAITKLALKLVPSSVQPVTTFVLLKGPN